MPATSQSTRQSGGDLSASSRSANSTQTSSSRTGKAKSTTRQTEDQSLVTRVTDANKKTTTTAAEETTQTQQEDHTGTISFSVKLNASLPCKEIPPFV